MHGFIDTHARVPRVPDPITGAHNTPKGARDLDRNSPEVNQPLQSPRRHGSTFGSVILIAATIYTYIYMLFCFHISLHCKIAKVERTRAS